MLDQHMNDMKAACGVKFCGVKFLVLSIGDKYSCSTNEFDEMNLISFK